MIKISFNVQKKVKVYTSNIIGRMRFRGVSSGSFRDNQNNSSSNRHKKILLVYLFSDLFLITLLEIYF